MPVASFAPVAPVSVPDDLAAFKFPRQGVPGDLATRVGCGLYYYPVETDAARRWFAGLWVSATNIFAGETVDRVLSYYDGCNEPGWIEVAGNVLERHPELVPWAEGALS